MPRPMAEDNPRHPLTRKCIKCHEDKSILDFWAEHPHICKSCYDAIAATYNDRRLARLQLSTIYMLQIDKDGVKQILKLCKRCGQWLPLYRYHAERRICRDCANEDRRADRKRKVLEQIKREREERKSRGG